MVYRFDGDVVRKAVLFAIDVHKGQVDDDGNDYFLSHLSVVGAIVRMVSVDEEVVAAAYLHDVVEDAGVSVDDLECVFGSRVSSLVLEVTHDGCADSHGFYFPRLESRDAVLIKFADRLSNLSRMGSWSSSRCVQYLRKSSFWRSS